MALCWHESESPQNRRHAARRRTVRAGIPLRTSFLCGRLRHESEMTFKTFQKRFVIVRFRDGRFVDNHKRRGLPGHCDNGPVKPIAR